MRSDTERELYKETKKKRKRNYLEERRSPKSKLSRLEKGCSTSQLSDLDSYSSGEERSIGSIDNSQSDEDLVTLADPEEGIGVLAQLDTIDPEVLFEENLPKSGIQSAGDHGDSSTEGRLSQVDVEGQNPKLSSQSGSFSDDESQESCASTLRASSLNGEDFVAREANEAEIDDEESQENVRHPALQQQVDPWLALWSAANVRIFIYEQPDDESSNDLETSETVQRSSETIYYPSSDGDDESVTVARQDLSARRHLNFDENRYEE